MLIPIGIIFPICPTNVVDRSRFYSTLYQNNCCRNCQCRNRKKCSWTRELDIIPKLLSVVFYSRSWFSHWGGIYQIEKFSLLKSEHPSNIPTDVPIDIALDFPSFFPSIFPTVFPGYTPTMISQFQPTELPNGIPYVSLIFSPTIPPSTYPSFYPGMLPIKYPNNVHSDLWNSAPSGDFSRIL